MRVKESKVTKGYKALKFLCTETLQVATAKEKWREMMKEEEKMGEKITA